MIFNTRSTIIQRFSNWARLKTELHFSFKTIYFRERQIWWTSIGQNIGSEQNGKNRDFERPILVVRKFNEQMFLGVPISTKLKQGKYFYQFNKNGKDFCIILSQIRLFSSNRLLRRIGKMSLSDYEQVKNRLRSIV